MALARRNRAVIALGCDGVLRARLGELPIPRTRDGFACRQVELEFPVGQRSRAGVVNRERLLRACNRAALVEHHITWRSIDNRGTADVDRYCYLLLGNG